MLAPTDAARRRCGFRAARRRRLCAGPRNTEQESLETRTSGTSPTVQCGEKVTKTCLAQKVDAMGAQLNTFLIEGPHYDKMYSIEAQLQAQIQQIWRALGSSPDGAPVIGEEPCTPCTAAQVHPADTCEYDSGELFDGSACVRRDATDDMTEQEKPPAESLPQGAVFNSRDEPHFNSGPNPLYSRDELKTIMGDAYYG